MRKLAVAFLVVVVALSAAVGVQAFTDHGKHKIKAGPLSGYNETPLALSSPGTGKFSARIDDQAQTISYTLTYSGLPTAAQQAHIHFGTRAQSGGISAFLCTNLGNGPAGTQACPATGGTITGTITPAQIIGPANQGIAAGEFNELVQAIRAGVAYVNVHTAQYPGGEIRAQLNDHGNKHDDHGNKQH
jgi:hypothetical protein